MGKASWGWRGFLTQAIGSLVIPVVIPLTSSAIPGPGFEIGQTAGTVAVKDEVPALEKQQAEALPNLPRPVPPSGAALPTYSLAQCIGIALSQQPALAAQKASLASAEDNVRALQGLKAPTFLVPELPVRRRQANLGVTVASAGVEQAEQETVYAVTRLYFSVLFAREQLQVGKKVVTDLSDALENAERLVKTGTGPKELTETAVEKNRIFLRLAQSKQIDAEEGMKRALAALRESMGVGPECCFQLPDAPLPIPDRKVCREDIIALALARRSEMVQAVTASEITSLEIQAQETSRRKKKMTFAAVADVHSKPIPTGVSDGEYRPGAVGIDMPTLFVGSKSARVERACDLNARMGAVVEKTRNLITLEAEDAYLKWETASEKLSLLQEAAKKSDEVATNTLADFKGGQNVPFREVLEGVVLAAQVRAQRNELVFQEILALAALERVTAGGFGAGLIEIVPDQLDPSK